MIHEYISQLLDRGVELENIALAKKGDVSELTISADHYSTDGELLNSRISNTPLIIQSALESKEILILDKAAIQLSKVSPITNGLMSQIATQLFDTQKLGVMEGLAEANENIEMTVFFGLLSRMFGNSESLISRLSNHGTLTLSVMSKLNIPSH